MTRCIGIRPASFCPGRPDGGARDRGCNRSAHPSDAEACGHLSSALLGRGIPRQHFRRAQRGYASGSGRHPVVGAGADAAVVHRVGLVDLDQRTGIHPEGRGRTGNYTKGRAAVHYRLGKAFSSDFNCLEKARRTAKAQRARAASGAPV
jgi:hypothetical protein